MRPSLLLLAPAFAVFMSGCAPTNSSSNDPLRGVAASFLAARHFDRALLAWKRGDERIFGPSNDALRSANFISLNGAGYMLAENGKSRADFESAVVLTRAALETATKILDSLPQNDPNRAELLFFRASGPRDSLAWALFKTGRLAEARQQQEQALREINSIDAKTPLTADIPFHMAEIYRALGENDKARKSYEEALKLGPDSVLDGRIRAGLAAL